ncbi:MAG: carboxypeptidase regulatory-like domain-containing protein, partial [Bryobacteraceae bacterium]
MRLGRAAAVAMVATMTASTAGAYYHFLRYSSRFAPFGPVPEKFDLNALPNRTVTFFVADSGAALVGDGFPSALNLIRDAAAAWNGVPTSELRVAFGGLHSAGTPQSTAGAEIYFEELDPLTLGLASPTVRGGLQPGNNGNAPFVPIVRSVVRLNRDLAQWRTPASGPSFHEAFFNTVVHEMGHALGLQHTFTSSAMSTEVTRSTTLARPIDADDAAGLSALYPSRNFAPSTGSLAGRVTYQGTNQGVHMASVVAIRPGGIAVSALTDPDGRYRIDGLAPNPYQLYVHPLPAVRRAGLTPGDMVLPVYPDGQPAAANTDFDTAFYQNGQTTREFLQASFVAATAGGTADNLNFAVRRRTTASLGAVTIYSFFGSTAVSPGFVNGGGSLVARGAGLAANNTPAAGLSAAFLGGTPTLLPTLRAYNGADLVLDIQPTSTFGGVGARHAVFTLPGDLHVRPNAIHLVQERPPSITAAIPGFDSAGGRTVTLAGTGLNAETRIYFDGVRAPDL